MDKPIIDFTHFGPGLLCVGTYPCGRVAVYFETPDKQRIATLTTAMPEVPLTSTFELHVKTWSENEMIVDDCLASGFWGDTGKRVPAGRFAEASVWEWTNKGMEALHAFIKAKRKEAQHAKAG